MLSLTEGVERRSDRMAEVSRGHSSCLFGAKGRTCHERIEGHLSDWLNRSLARGLVVEVGAGSADGYSKCPETSRRMVNETKLTPATEEGYGNDSRQNGPFGLRGSNSPLLEVNLYIARRRRWFITWRFCISDDVAPFANHIEHPLVREAGFSATWIISRLS